MVSAQLHFYRWIRDVKTEVMEDPGTSRPPTSVCTLPHSIDLLDLILNSVTLVLSVAHKFKLTLCVDVGADLYAGCSGMYKVHAVESSSN